MKNVTEQNKIQNDIYNFLQRANAMIESKYILAAKKISSLLKGIVAIPLLMDNVAHCLRSFSYATEFARNRMLVSDGDQVKTKMTLPVDKVRLFTFVFCLLAEIDSGSRDLTKFLNEYFESGSLNDSYDRFCAEIIVPFKKAGEKILKDADPDYVDLSSVQKGSEFFVAEEIYMSPATSDSAITLLEKVRIRLDNDFQGDGQDRVECVEMTDALINAILSKNPKLISIIWIGFKNTFMLVKGFEKEIENLNTVLSEANLI
ncbi:MAG: hypothetical protein IJ999_03235 [Clostridia bacterium]|nr:hypothetical protein [Clostridia bacterium]